MASVPNLFLSAQHLVSCAHPKHAGSALGFRGHGTETREGRALVYRLEGGLERVNRHEVGLDTGVDAEAQGVVVHADLLLQAAARHSRRCCCSVSVTGWLALLSLRGRKEGFGRLGLGLIYTVLQLRV
jgi:hypothetical protein